MPHNEEIDPEIMNTTNAWGKDSNYSVKVASIQQLANWNIGLKNNNLLNQIKLSKNIYFNI